MSFAKDPGRLHGKSTRKHSFITRRALFMFQIGMTFVAEDGRSGICPCTQTTPSIASGKLGTPKLALTQQLFRLDSQSGLFGRPIEDVQPGWIRCRGHMY